MRRKEGTTQLNQSSLVHCFLSENSMRRLSSTMHGVLRNECSFTLDRLFLSDGLFHSHADIQQTNLIRWLPGGNPSGSLLEGSLFRRSFGHVIP
jgi:hypothetical protein